MSFFAVWAATLFVRGCLKVSFTSVQFIPIKFRYINGHFSRYFNTLPAWTNFKFPLCFCNQNFTSNTFFPYRVCMLNLSLGCLLLIWGNPLLIYLLSKLMLPRRKMCLIIRAFHTTDSSPLTNGHLELPKGGRTSMLIDTINSKKQR